MTKSKNQNKKKPTGKNVFMQTVVVIVILAFVGYFIFSLFKTSTEPKSSEVDRTMNNKITYTFQKEGELLFTDSNGDTISKIDIEIADDNLQRELGLMMRRGMAENQGMLFIFPVEMIQSFWMKNTIMPLDIIFVNSQMEIVKIHKNTTPYSEQTYPSGKPSIYVVEVIAGYTDKLGIKEGDKIVYRRD